VVETIRIEEEANMGKDTARRGRLAAIAALGLLAGLGALGCQKNSPPAAQADANNDTTPAKVEGASGVNPATDPLHRFRQSFAEATRADAYADWEPVEKTIAGKAIGPLYEQVKQNWDNVKLVTSDGKKLTYVATLDTDMGTIEIELRPELAPNHVRSFVALIQAGYYDGLVFERTVTEQAEHGAVQLIEGGAPDGGIKSNTDGIGYWLKPEINTAATHEEGTVGAPHGIEEDTAACRFYIMVSKAPDLDGHWTVFGKVTQGRDVARTIFRQPTKEDVASPGVPYPLKPVVIRKAAVRSQEIETASK
jgi:peptidyl-prolyl cis-trans isomerase B (cyclophilin B)